ncbi:unnamed protein product [Boreogadus saida]
MPRHPRTGSPSAAGRAARACMAVVLVDGGGGLRGSAVATTQPTCRRGGGGQAARKPTDAGAGRGGCLPAGRRRAEELGDGPWWGHAAEEWRLSTVWRRHEERRTACSRCYRGARSPGGPGQSGSRRREGMLPTASPWSPGAAPGSCHGPPSTAGVPGPPLTHHPDEGEGRGVMREERGVVPLELDTYTDYMSSLKLHWITMARTKLSCLSFF